MFLSRTLTDESDKYSLSKAVSAPLKYTKNFQTEQVADKARYYVTKRNSWDEVSCYDYNRTLLTQEINLEYRFICMLLNVRCNIELSNWIMSYHNWSSKLCITRKHVYTLGL